MNIVSAKCPNCGANLEVDKEKEAGICKFCGLPFITDKAINNNIILNDKIKNETNISVEYETIKITWEETQHSQFNDLVEILIDGVCSYTIKNKETIEVRLEKNKSHFFQVQLKDKKSNILNLDILSDLLIFTDYILHVDKIYFLKEIILCTKTNAHIGKEKINKTDLENKQKAKKHKIIIALIVTAILLPILIIAISVSIPKYEARVVKSEIISENGDTAMVTIEIDNKTNEKKYYYVQIELRWKDDDLLAAKEETYVIVEANSTNEWYVLITSEYGFDLSNTYAKISYISDVTR